MTREFMGRRISKEIINLGIGGQIERGGADLPPRSTVEFTARGLVSKVSHKFLEDGSIEEMTVLTIDKDSFEVLAVQPAAEQQELPLKTGTVTVDDANKVAAEMGVRTADGSAVALPPLAGPLLVSCEACGHGRGDHEAGADGEPHTGACLVMPCVCQQYVPFQETPAEEEMEPAESITEGAEVPA